jgi:hypothetical protein
MATEEAESVEEGSRPQSANSGLADDGGAGRASPAPNPRSEATEPDDRLAEFLAGHSRILATAWMLAAVFFLCIIPVGYLTWYTSFKALWDWEQFHWWAIALKMFGSLGLILAPLMILAMAVAFATFLANVSLRASEGRVRKARDALRDAEREALDRLEKSDEPRLLPLLKYSRAQLEAYYAVGLGQARKSFMNSVLAMWLGFLVLLAGLAYQVVAPHTNLGSPSSDFKNLTLGSGAIIEFISAAFLWVYRSATVQLTTFYDRQMQTHASVLSFRIAATMGNEHARDRAKAAIVDSILANKIQPPTMGRGDSHAIGRAAPKKRKGIMDGKAA